MLVQTRSWLSKLLERHDGLFEILEMTSSLGITVNIFGM